MKRLERIRAVQAHTPTLINKKATLRPGNPGPSFYLHYACFWRLKPSLLHIRVCYIAEPVGLGPGAGLGSRHGSGGHEKAAGLSSRLVHILGRA